jgi:hypothetical protein
MERVQRVERCTNLDRFFVHNIRNNLHVAHIQRIAEITYSEIFNLFQQVQQMDEYRFPILR